MEACFKCLHEPAEEVAHIHDQYEHGQVEIAQVNRVALHFASTFTKKGCAEGGMGAFRDDFIVFTRVLTKTM